MIITHGLKGDHPSFLSHYVSRMQGEQSDIGTNINEHTALAEYFAHQLHLLPFIFSQKIQLLPYPVIKICFDADSGSQSDGFVYPAEQPKTLYNMLLYAVIPFFKKREEEQKPEGSR